MQELLSARLQQLPALADLPPGGEASAFSLPPALAGEPPDAPRARQARAFQEHALALAEARVGSKWWLPLRRLNAQQRAGGGGWAAARDAAWDEEDRAWRREWERISREAAARPSGVAGAGGGRRGVQIEYSLEVA